MNTTANIETGSNAEQNIAAKSCPHPVNEKAVKRFKIIEGQVRGVRRMVEEEKYCIDILTQISAVRAALDSVAKIILKKHIDTCVTDAIRNKAENSRELIDELMSIFVKEEI